MPLLVFAMFLLIMLARPSFAQEGERGAGLQAGTLLLCGGGRLSTEVLDAFYRLGDGPQGRLVLIPTASPRSDGGDYSPWLEVWGQYAWKRVDVVHVQDRSDAENPSHLGTLRGATAVWIGGGDQARLSERLAGTPIEAELRGMLDRGCVVGGTSAGAAICSQVMIREGVQEPILGSGFPFLKDVIVDQHFGAKKRQERLSRAVGMHPDLAGLGIDEGTGMICRCDGIEVIGQGGIHWYQAGRRERSNDHAPDALWNAGERIPWSRVTSPAMP